MITVSIVGILAAIGIPAYNHQVNVSHQKEAKANLLALDVSMKSFWSEYTAATSRFDEIGFKPTGTLNYTIGFTADLPGPVTALSYVAADTSCYDTFNHFATCRAGFAQWINSPSSVAFTIAGANSFPGGAISWVGYAEAQLVGGGLADEWSIDSTDNVVNIQSGI